MEDFDVAEVDVDDLGEDEEEDYNNPQTQHTPMEASTPSPSQPDSVDDLPTPRRTRLAKPKIHTGFRMARKDHYPTVFGPDLEDLYPVLQSRDLWHLNSRDLVFPSRATLKEALRLDSKGEYLERKSQEGTASISSQHQQIEEITKDDAIERRYLQIGEPHDVVVGASNTPQKHTIQHHESFQVAQAWQRVPADGTAVTDGSAIDNAYRKGWLMNLGARPQCLAWASSPSNDQFLAVTFRCSKSQRDTAPPRESKLAPAFSPSPPYSSRIEIWRFKAKPGVDEEPAQLDHHTPPRLVLVLCARYGNILKMEWLPIISTSPQHHLCILTSDGNIRVFHLDLVDHESPLYLLAKQPQFIATSPPNTIFTSFNFPNPHDLLASDAAGAIHLFSLLSDSQSLTPYSSLQIHMTYITAITCVPSHPQYIVTTSAAGEIILTDVRSPTIDRVRLQTARLPTRNLSYLPHTRTFLTTLDSASRYESIHFHGPLVISHSLRDFKTSKPILRLPLLGGTATCLAASSFHPVVAVGNAGGTVYTCNYVRRCLPIGNAKKDRVGAWMGRVFEYEWRGLMEREVQERKTKGGEKSDGAAADITGDSTRSMSKVVDTDDTNTLSQNPSSPPNQTTPQQEQNPDEDPIDLYHGPSLPKTGISKFTEGFTPERAIVSNLDAARSSTSKSKSTGKAKSKSKSKSAAGSKRKAQTKSRSRNAGTSEDDLMDLNEDDEDGEEMDDEDAEAEDGSAGQDNSRSNGSSASKAIYHEEQAVSAIAWNGNLNPRFASWIAVAWGSGIVRVADLAHDVVQGGE